MTKAKRCTRQRKNRQTRKTRPFGCESLEARQLLAGDLLAADDVVGLEHGPGCSCPGCCSQGEAVMLGEGHYIGDGHDHSDMLQLPEGWVTPPLDRSGSTGPLTIILDFNDPLQGNTSVTIGGDPDVVSTWDHTTFDTLGGTAPNRAVIEADVLTYMHQYFNSDLDSALLPQYDLNIAFEIGDVGTPPANGASEYYYIQIGSYVDGISSDPDTRGSAYVSSVRNSTGGVGSGGNGAVFGSAFTDRIAAQCGALCGWTGIQPQLAIAKTVAHEIGHGLSLLHVSVANSATPSGLPPIMSTGAIDGTFAQTYENFQQFAIAAPGYDIDDVPTGMNQFSRDQLIAAVGAVDTDVNDQVSEAIPLTFGTSTPAALEWSSDVDLYRFDVATANQSVAFDLDRDTGDLDAELRIFDSAGTLLASNDDAAGPTPEPGGVREPYLEYQFATPGTYYVGVADYQNDNYDIFTGLGDVSGSGRTGIYRLHAINLDNLVVDTQADESDNNFSAGDLSLREAIEIANGSSADTITFGPSLSGQTILLNGNQLEVEDSVTIDASMLNDNVTIHANGFSRVVDFSTATADDTLTLQSVNLGGGRVTGGFGGAIFSGFGAVTLDDATVSDNRSDAGGAIWSSVGAITLTNSTVTGNSSAGIGGGIGKNFESLTLNNSEVINNESASQGGGIAFAFGGSVMLTDSTVSGNSSGAEGGGVFIDYGAVTVNNSIVSSNTSAASGGGIRSVSAPITVVDSTVSGNSALAGGGIFQASGVMTLDNSTVSDNTAAGNGGGIIMLYDGQMTMTDSTVSGNSAGDNAAGIFGASNLTANISDSIISANTAASRGGGIFSRGALTVSQSTLDGNVAGSSTNQGGGAIFGEVGTVDVVDSTLVNNSGANGAAIWLSGAAGTISNTTVSSNNAALNAAVITNGGSSLHISSSTIVDNTSVGGAAGVYRASGSDPLTIENTIVFNDDIVPDVRGSITVESLGHNLFGTVHGATVTTQGTDLIGVDPMVAALADNGGPTETHALLPSSPAVDTGDPSAVAGMGGVPDFDQRGMGFPRVVGGRIDIGAFEVQPPPCTVAGDLDCSGLVGASDLDLVLNNWGVDSSVAGVPAGWVHDLPDGIISAGELDNVLNNWGNTSVLATPVIPVQQASLEVGASSLSDQQPGLSAGAAGAATAKQVAASATDRLLQRRDQQSAPSWLRSLDADAEDQQEAERLSALDAMFASV